jgi:hypothetical protein
VVSILRTSTSLGEKEKVDPFANAPNTNHTSVEEQEQCTIRTSHDPSDKMSRKKSHQEDAMSRKNKEAPVKE